MNELVKPVYLSTFGSKFLVAKTKNFRTHGILQIKSYNYLRTKYTFGLTKISSNKINSINTISCFVF